MSIQSAMLFGLLIGLTLFLLYLSVISHHEQLQDQKPKINEVNTLFFDTSGEEKKQKIFMRDPVSKVAPDGTSTILSLPKEELSILQKATSMDKESSPSLDTSESLSKKLPSQKLMKLTDLDPEVACVRMKKKYSVVPGISWGSLPTELQKLDLHSY